MNMRFKHLDHSNFNLLLSWLRDNHVNTEASQQVYYISNTTKKKQPNIKKDKNINKTIYAFMIYFDKNPVGYIQYYDAKDSKYDLRNLPESLAVVDMFISNNIDQSATQKILELFLTKQLFKEFNYALADLSIKDIADISCYEKAGFTEFKMAKDRVLLLASKKIVRLPTLDIAAIECTFRDNWLPNDSIWIFGSRADLSRKGGDIDIYIETHAKTVEQAFNMQQQFTLELINKIGEQKVDVVLNMLNFPENLPIYEVAKNEGVKIL